MRSNLDAIDYTRKPSSWDVVSATVPEDTDLSGLPTFTTTELDIVHPLTDFAKETPQFFILTNDVTGKRYLVDTQGYTYVRYAAEIK